MMEFKRKTQGRQGGFTGRDNKLPTGFSDIGYGALGVWPECEAGAEAGLCSWLLRT